jgi:uncharacterized membrane protein (DUF4010 family)
MENLILQFLIAIALGALIGLEREYARFRRRGHIFAGVRTFPLIALLGALAAYLGEQVSIWILIVSIGLIGSLIIVAYFSLVHMDRRHSGATSEVAGLLTFFIGMLTFYGPIRFAVALAVILTIILHLRSVLHHFAKKISPKEMADTITYAVLAFIILPFLPNEWYGPLDLFNPFVLWLMVVLISGISFFGYALMKWFGEKGVGLAGILGGLVSSTAVTLSFANRSKKGAAKALALGVILANSIMFIRVLVEVFIINRPLFIKLLLPFLTLASISGIFSYYLWQNVKQVKGKIDLKSPLSLKSALEFGALFALILALVKVADFYLASRGVYVVSLISGIADVDAITVSLSQLAKTTLDLETATKGILLAALTNVSVKGGMSWFIGGKQFRKYVVGLFTSLVIIGVIFLIFL